MQRAKLPEGGAREKGPKDNRGDNWVTKDNWVTNRGPGGEQQLEKGRQESGD